MKIKKLLNLGMGTSLVSLPLLSVVSCEKPEEFNPEIHLNKEFTAVQKSVSRFKVVDGADGDTVVLEALEDNQERGIKKGDINKIRLAGIDTPEKAVGGVRSTDYEYSYAEKSSAFASKTLKVGKIIYAYITSKDSFKRWVGDIFYSETNDDPTSIDEVNRSYSVQITRAGLTLPYDSNPIQNIELQKYKGTLQWYTWRMLGIAMANAEYYNDGFFADFWNPWSISRKVYLQKPLGNAFESFTKYGDINVFQNEDVYKASKDNK